MKKRTLLPLFISSMVLATSVSANTSIPSANGNPWDVQDNTGSDNGNISDGGQDAFDSWGALQLRVMDTGNAIIGTSGVLSGYGLSFDAARSWNTSTPVISNGIAVSRSLFSPAATDYMRYFDSFTNTTGQALRLRVSWGDNLGSDSRTTLAATSSGDLNLTSADQWALTIENSAFNPAGPAADPPVAYVTGNTAALIGFGAPTNISPFNNPWPGNGEDDLSFIFQFDLNPGETGSLVNFLYRGLKENVTGPLGQNPATGTQIALARQNAAALLAAPDFSGLSAGQLAGVRNWSVQSVPEPTTLALLAVGIGAAVGRRRPLKAV